MARGLLGVSGVESAQIQAYGLVVVGVPCLEFHFHSVQLQVYTVIRVISTYKCSYFMPLVLVKPHEALPGGGGHEGI